MKSKVFHLGMILVVFGCLFLSGCAKWKEEDIGLIRIVANRSGQTLGYSETSGIQLVFDSGFAFKDLNKSGELDPYEDWRLPADERAKDLASKMSIEQIAGLMLYSAHQSIPASGGMFAATYQGSRLRTAARILPILQTTK